MRKQNNLESVECVGVGSPNPLGEKPRPYANKLLRLDTYQHP